MRSAKQSDSPSQYDRDINPTRGRVTVATIQHDFATALTRLNTQRVRDGVTVPALEDVHVVLGVIEGLAKAARLETFQSTLDSLGALAIAARLALSRAEMVSPTSGGPDAA